MLLVDCKCVTTDVIRDEEAVTHMTSDTRKPIGYF